MTKNNDVSIVKRMNMLPTLHGRANEASVSPSTDVYETPDAFVVMIDLPGVHKEAINLTMDNGTLCVKAKVERHHSEQALLRFNELGATVYERLFNLGDGIDRESIDASHRDGVLTIKLSKSERAKPRVIHIK